MKKHVLSLLAIILLSAFAAAQENNEAERGFMFAFGLGFGAVNYTPELDAIISDLESLGISRVVVNLQLTLGYAMTRDLYATAGVTAIGDRLEDDYGDYFQLNTYLYGLGLRFYPFHTGLVLGLDAGPANVVVDTSLGYRDRSPLGAGTRLSAAYDFARDPTGFGLAVGASATYSLIEGDGVSSASLYAQLLWK